MPTTAIGYRQTESLDAGPSRWPAMIWGHVAGPSSWFRMQHEKQCFMVIIHRMIAYLTGSCESRERRIIMNLVSEEIIITQEKKERRWSAIWKSKRLILNLWRAIKKIIILFIVLYAVLTAKRTWLNIVMSWMESNYLFSWLKTMEKERKKNQTFFFTSD